MTVYKITQISVYDALDLMDQQTDSFIVKAESTRYNHGCGEKARQESELHDELAASVAQWRYWEDDD